MTTKMKRRGRVFDINPLGIVFIDDNKGNIRDFEKSIALRNRGFIVDHNLFLIEIKSDTGMTMENLDFLRKGLAKKRGRKGNLLFLLDWDKTITTQECFILSTKKTVIEYQEYALQLFGGCSRSDELKRFISEIVADPLCQYLILTKNGHAIENRSLFVDFIKQHLDETFCDDRLIGVQHHASKADHPDLLRHIDIFPRRVVKKKKNRTMKLPIIALQCESP
jgi:hypothetical protein